jgi:DinB family protein
VIAELETYQDQVTSIQQDAAGLMDGLSDAQFNWRPGSNRWSMGECFDHLNISAKTLFVPGIDGAIADAKSRGLLSQGPFVHPALQRWFLHVSEPPPKMRFKAPGKVKQKTPRPVNDVRQEFLDWQDRLGERIRLADGLDLRRASHGTLWRWTLGTYIAVCLAHERRHIWQARQVRNEPGFPA